MCNLNLRPPCCSKRRSTYITAGSAFFLVGVEYAIIIPTLNLYLSSMGASAFFMGFCLAAMSLTSLLSAPIYGRITDITRTTKGIVFLSNLFAIGGNVLYAISTNPYMVIASRLVVGLAAGSFSSMISMISRSTTKAERTSTMSKIFAGRQTGLVIGPSFNLLLANCDFYIFSVHVGSYNSPGFLMAAFWILETILLLFFYYDLDPIEPEGLRDDATNDSLTNSSEEPSTSQAESETAGFMGEKQRRSFLYYVYNDLVTEESVLFLTMTFVIMFVQVGMEALITPLSKIYFKWGEVENSVFYLGQGVLYVVSLLSLAYTSKKIRDRCLIVFGLAALTLNSLLFLILIVYAGYLPDGDPTKWLYFMFILYGVILSLTMAYVWVPLLSLFTKFTSEENQGFTQGVRMIFNGLGKILGPIWASSLLNINLSLLTSVNLGLYLLVSTMLFITYKKIVRRERKLDDDEERTSSFAENESEKPSESTPLLTNSRKEQERC